MRYLLLTSLTLILMLTTTMCNGADDLVVFKIDDAADSDQELTIAGIHRMRSTS